MAEGKKRVIILDEKKAGGKKADGDETEKLQEELDRYDPIEDDEPVETPSVQSVHIKVRKKKANHKRYGTTNAGTNGITSSKKQ